MTNTYRATTFALLMATVACGGTEETQGSDFPIDVITLTLSQVSSTNDCDPAKGNPGDFEVFIEGFVKDDYTEFGPWDLKVVSTPVRFTLMLRKVT